MDEMMTANLMRFAFKLELMTFRVLEHNIDKLQLRLLRQYKETHG